MKNISKKKTRPPVRNTEHKTAGISYHKNWQSLTLLLADIRGYEGNRSQYTCSLFIDDIERLQQEGEERLKDVIIEDIDGYKIPRVPKWIQEYKPEKVGRVRAPRQYPVDNRKQATSSSDEITEEDIRQFKKFRQMMKMMEMMQDE